MGALFILYKAEVRADALTALISAGVMDCYGYARVDLLSIKENFKDIFKIFDNLKEIEFDEYNLLIDKKENNQDDVLILEKETFGFYLTMHPVTKYYKQVGEKIIKIKNLKSENLFQIILCLVLNIRIIKDKNNNDMAFLTLSDPTGEIGLTIFGKDFEAIKNNLKVNDILLLKIKTQIYKENISCVYEVDGNGLLFRAFHAGYNQTILRTSNGTPINAVYGFLNMLLNFLSNNEYYEVIVAFDKGKTTFRNEMLITYKANRSETPVDLIPQFSIVRESVEALGMKYIELENYEADDIIGSLSTKYSKEYFVDILSSDKDMFQLVNKKVNVITLKSGTSDVLVVNEKEVENILGVKPNKVTDYKGIVGDTADNIKGVAGIGPKGAVELLQLFGTLENIYENIENNTSEIYTYDIKKTIFSLEKLGYVVDISKFKYDMMLACYLINPNIKSEFDKQILIADNSLFIQSDEEIFGKGVKRTSLIDPKIKHKYISEKSFLISKTKNILQEKLIENNLLKTYQNIELPFVKELYKMEKAGIQIDRKELEIQTENIFLKINDIDDEIQKIVKPLGSTDKETLESILDNHEIIPLLINHRKFSKLYSTYLKGFEKYIFKDDRVHTIFHQTLTSTGRLSSQEPNIQNISVRDNDQKNVRKIFTTVKENIFLSYDYSQIELRVLANIANEKNMLSIFLKNGDIHEESARKIFNLDADQKVDSEMRRKAKIFNFGIIYGLSDFGLSKDLKISIPEAKEFIDKYFETFPGILEFKNNIIDFARKNGYVTTQTLRKRFVNELSDAKRMIQQFGERIAVNTPIQGTAADILKVSIIQIGKEFEKNNLNSKIVAQIHDEIIIDTLISEKEIVEKIVEKNMKNAYKDLFKLIDLEEEFACYHDTRRFGTMHLQNKENYREILPISKIGPEPFEDNMTPNYLSEKIRNSTTAIKTKLLDQTIIAGIGNIYSDEVCFRAKIDPRTPAKNLNLNQLQDIIKSSKEVLKRAIELGGTTIDSYQAQHGVDGKFQNELKVHTRKGLKCKEWINFDSFQNQISRLEAMKLIETLINNKKGSIAFKIYAPLEPSLFFESDIFRALLAKKVQKEQYESIKFIFKDETIDYSEYENISASINNVFKEELESIQESDSVALKMIKYNSNPILDKINYQYILEILNKNDIPLNIKTSKYKEIINAIAINYGFSNEEIAEIFIKTVKKFGIKFDKKALDSIISDMYSDILQKQPTVTLDEPINAKLDSKTKKLFELKNIDSETYICSILKEKIISPISKDIIYTLRDTYKLSDPVINTLLDYAHFKSDGKIVPAYVNKIASTLFEMDIHNSLEKSMEHLKAAHKSKKRFYVDKEKASAHITAGAKKCIISAPATGDLKTIVYGVNHKTLTAADTVVSGASCTTNCLAPVAKVLDEKFGIVKGLMNTIHAVTNDQRLLDLPHDDLRRGRAATFNIIPSKTGAAAAVGKVLPQLNGKLDGLALRVPTITGSIVDLTVELKEKVTADQINKAVEAAVKADKDLAMALEYNTVEIVSSDIIGSTHGSIYDATMTRVMEVEGKQMVKVFS
ncbi:hypothetical protein FQR65_LT16465 [Abscondita terminalis]|nr:hypothetical protein FQR65_LT16465 [Abscondita terminalis]